MEKVLVIIPAKADSTRFIGKNKQIIEGKTLVEHAISFAKSSQRFYDWIIQNKLFGHHVKNYREGKGIPRKSKPIILATMWTFVLFAVLIAIPDSAPPVSKITTLVLAIIGTIFILRIPNL